jgi:hypothetical protein
VALLAHEILALMAARRDIQCLERVKGGLHKYLIELMRDAYLSNIDA